MRLKSILFTLITLVYLILYSMKGDASASLPESYTTLSKSSQLLVVRTKSWHSIHGSLQRYQRNAAHKWIAIGEPVPIVVGKHGLSGNAILQTNDSPLSIKKEGDLRTPAGIFLIGSAFGFAIKPEPIMQMKYRALTDDSICVDDPMSKYYNVVVDANRIENPDWRSGEHMKQIPFYKWGAIIQYNTNHPVLGAGSCIFMHIWRNADKGTAGCIAMSETRLKQVLAWLEPAKIPAIVLLTENEYKLRQKAWDLPS